MSDDTHTQYCGCWMGEGVACDCQPWPRIHPHCVACRTRLIRNQFADTSSGGYEYWSCPTCWDTPRFITE